MIDSHCHLDHELLNKDLSNIIQRSKNIGVEKLLTISTNLNSFKKILQIIEKDEMIFGTFGIHPHEVKNDLITSNQIIDEVKGKKKIIGIGETGLDFYYNHSEKDLQIKSFEEHIKASIELELPLIVHSRNAEKETYEVLNQFRKKKPNALFHRNT